jgi:hypothetical protein
VVGTPDGIAVSLRRKRPALGIGVLPTRIACPDRTASKAVLAGSDARAFSRPESFGDHVSARKSRRLSRRLPGVKSKAQRSSGVTARKLKAGVRRSHIVNKKGVCRMMTADL